MSEGEFEQDRVITLIGEDGKEEDFEVIDIMEINGTEYAILLPVDDENEEGEAIILKFDKDEDGSDVLVDIEDDEEWERVADAWEEMLVEEVE
jgi:uncharacterized protein YrzB (UPF0473 family)